MLTYTKYPQKLDLFGLVVPGVDLLTYGGLTLPSTFAVYLAPGRAWMIPFSSIVDSCRSKSLWRIPVTEEMSSRDLAPSDTESIIFFSIRDRFAECARLAEYVSSVAVGRSSDLELGQSSDLESGQSSDLELGQSPAGSKRVPGADLASFCSEVSTG